jgi:hypothetical protein
MPDDVFFVGVSLTDFGLFPQRLAADMTIESPGTRSDDAELDADGSGPHSSATRGRARWRARR